MKFPPFLHSHLRLTLLGTPPNRVFLGRLGKIGPYLQNQSVISLTYTHPVWTVSKIKSELSVEILTPLSDIPKKDPYLRGQPYEIGRKPIFRANFYYFKYLFTILEFLRWILSCFISNKRQSFPRMTRRTSVTGIRSLLNPMTRHPWGNCWSHVT